MLRLFLPGLEASLANAIGVPFCTGWFGITLIRREWVEFITVRMQPTTTEGVLDYFDAWVEAVFFGSVGPHCLPGVVECAEKRHGGSA